MKNIIRFFFALCIFFFGTGCSTDYTADINSQNPDMVQTQGDTVSEISEPPRILAFDSLEKLAELKSMLEQGEAAIADYLDRKIIA